MDEESKVQEEELAHANEVKKRLQRKSFLRVGARINLNFDPLIIVCWDGINGFLNRSKISHAGLINNYGNCNFWPIIPRLAVTNLGDPTRSDDKQGDKDDK